MIWRLDGGVHHAEAGGVQGGKKGRKKERKKESKKAWKDGRKKKGYEMKRSEMRKGKVR
jgi:hypothetical protein